MTDLAELLANVGPGMLAELAEREMWPTFNRLYLMFPENGPLWRELYPKHLDFFAAGARHQERAFVAANRVGKSVAVCYEAVCHLIGWYPAWWQGYRFSRSIVAWICGEDTKAVRESLQGALLGQPGSLGTGLIPRDRIERVVARSGVPDAVDAMQIHHAYGGSSRLVFKAYEMGREAFQAAKVDVVVLDEEPPQPIYSEALTRTMSTVPGEASGLVLCAFTPLKGLSAVVQSFMPGGERREGEVGYHHKS
jgi:phage terminase large subunit-like protein